MKISLILENKLKKLFQQQGYDEALAVVTLSNKPEICDFQCNACFKLAKILHKPIPEIANSIVETFNKEGECAQASFCAPGFINFVVKDEFLAKLATSVLEDKRVGVEKFTNKKVVLDFGGANIAKPLHVGHLRSAVVGESIKRIARFCGDEVLGDAHLGDWGLQMGLILCQLEDEIDLSYFFEGKGEMPDIPLEYLNTVYPRASARSKQDESFKERAKQTTYKLQTKTLGVYDLYLHIKKMCVEAVDEEYKRLGVFFDYFYGESDAQGYVEPVVEIFKNKGLTQLSSGATIVDVSREDDKEPMPPVILKATSGADLYATTELATILMRKQLFNPDEIWYVTDDRQSLHFKQVFRAARLAGLVEDNVALGHYTFGTVNGKDGKPFKTRDGGVMALGDLYQLICDKAREKIEESSKQIDKNLPEIIGVSALKFGDLINYRSKDYVFDIDKFVSFDGKTGPYIQYCAVRIKSILNKCPKTAKTITKNITELERKIILECFNFEQALRLAYLEKAPSYIAQNMFDIAQAFSTFYNSTKIITEQDEEKRNNHLLISTLVLKTLETGLDLLGITVPDAM